MNNRYENENEEKMYEGEEYFNYHNEDSILEAINDGDHLLGILCNYILK